MSVNDDLEEAEGKEKLGDCKEIAEGRKVEQVRRGWKIIVITPLDTLQRERNSIKYKLELEMQSFS